MTRRVAKGTQMDRRTMLLGAVTATVPAAVLARAGEARADGAGDPDVLAGTVVAHRAGDVLEIAVGDHRVLAETARDARLVHHDGSAATLDDFAVGDAITVAVRGGTDGRAVRVHRVTPAVLGVRSDVQR